MPANNRTAALALIACIIFALMALYAEQMWLKLFYLIFTTGYFFLFMGTVEIKRRS